MKEMIQDLLSKIQLCQQPDTIESLQILTTLIQSSSSSTETFLSQNGIEIVLTLLKDASNQELQYHLLHLLEELSYQSDASTPTLVNTELFGLFTHFLDSDNDDLATFSISILHNVCYDVPDVIPLLWQSGVITTLFQNLDKRLQSLPITETRTGKVVIRPDSSSSILKSILDLITTIQSGTQMLNTQDFFLPTLLPFFLMDRQDILQRVLKIVYLACKDNNPFCCTLLQVSIPIQQTSTRQSSSVLFYSHLLSILSESHQQYMQTLSDFRTFWWGVDFRRKGYGYHCELHITETESEIQTRTKFMKKLEASQYIMVSILQIFGNLAYLEDEESIQLNLGISQALGDIIATYNAIVTLNGFQMAQTDSPDYDLSFHTFPSNINTDGDIKKLTTSTVMVMHQALFILSNLCGGTDEHAIFTLTHLLPNEHDALTAAIKLIHNLTTFPSILVVSDVAGIVQNLSIVHALIPTLIDADFLTPLYVYARGLQKSNPDEFLNLLNITRQLTDSRIVPHALLVKAAKQLKDIDALSFIRRCELSSDRQVKQTAKKLVLTMEDLELTEGCDFGLRDEAMQPGMFDGCFAEPSVKL
ncbi:hypothetical protein BLNAU_3533 [Blattamonas nauphoetae]|uniref:Uncharacterized protein n=1 Tax=Blattamonas nauphoetae TaxID=2049346 RepID=A0ABQ9YCC2_9EUKA|nr:hypothetical protein BLNAU_3533 [Blattamonas nauphoetae]